MVTLSWYPGKLLKRLIAECDEIKDKEERLRCKFRKLHEVTQEQDQINLNIRTDLNDDKDPRWIPIHMMDDANAIILEISQADGHIGDIGYIQEKIEGLRKKLFLFKVR